MDADVAAQVASQDDGAVVQEVGDFNVGVATLRVSGLSVVRSLCRFSASSFLWRANAAWAANLSGSKQPPRWRDFRRTTSTSEELASYESTASSECTRFKSRSISELLFLNQSVDQIRCIDHP